MRAARAAILVTTLLLFALAAAAAPRPNLTSGACLSCHARDVATLPARPCFSCHSGNMAFLQEHDGGGNASLWLLGAAGGGGLALMALLLVVGTRRLLPAVACLGIALLAAVPGSVPGKAALPGGVSVASGFACDLAPTLSPNGTALLFARRGPDTSGDGAVDLRDGLALFLLRRGWAAPKRVTAYALDAQGAMAAWSPDGSRFAVPLPASGAHPPGLGLFDGRGQRAAFLPAECGEVITPAFSPDGTRVAFVEGAGIALWDLRTDARTWALEPLPGGQFPRLYGWSPLGDVPVFTRGFDYARLQRDREGARIFPAEVPVEGASDGLAHDLTPSGPVPLRRFKAQPVDGGIFYLAQAPRGAPGLFFSDGKSEVRWSPEDSAVAGFAALDSGACWAWLAKGQGASHLVRFDGPGRFRPEGPDLKANLVALAAGRPGTAWSSGALAGGGSRRLFKNGSENSFATGGAVFGLAAAGGALAVVIAEPADAEGDAEPWDRARLWLMWEAP